MRISDWSSDVCSSDLGVTVRYYYLGNEPYHKTANYMYTAEEYAEMINRYAEAMRKVDPDIRIIANTHPRNLDYTSTLIRQAGKIGRASCRESVCQYV